MYIKLDMHVPKIWKHDDIELVGRIDVVIRQSHH